MKIKIQTKSGALERNWYIQDLDCYTPEFLQQIILNLIYNSPQSTGNESSMLSKASIRQQCNEITSYSKEDNCKPETPEDTIQSKHKVEIDKDYELDVRDKFNALKRESKII